MSPSPISPPRTRWVATAAGLAALSLPCAAQNFSMQVADANPLGIGSFVPDLQGLDLDFTEGIKGAFFYQVAGDVEYNSNLFLTDGGEESDVSLNLAPSVRYISDPEGGAEVSLSANYRPVFSAFLENSDLNDLTNSGDFTLTLRGSRTLVNVFGRLSELSGSDRLTGDFVEGMVMTGGVRAVRRIATRTALTAGWTSALSDYSSSADQGADIHTGYFGGIWQATERVGLGSTLRYTLRESQNIESYDSWALLMDVRYRVGERIWLSASLGPEFSGASGAGGDVRLTGNLSSRYVIDERWTWNTRFQAATIPAPSEANYVVNDLSLRSELQRRLLRGWVTGGLELSFSDYQDTGVVAVARDDETNLSAFVTYRRQLFSERLAFDSTLRYSINDGFVDWDQWLISAGLNVTF